ncbi:uncharacterized protein LOC106463176 isoform X2 [Limulus polyphemus]|uniref:Uncharacterized protein LOC106463176 isoform X2 n=1 Tax=Limulus polyphemus TaxID=6850 RepID=A0ABM1BBF5_LIMPO|nr:uncharacterized protein LOC106463176 isoform X2 [Limulus polyphemus]
MRRSVMRRLRSWYLPSIWLLVWLVVTPGHAAKDLCYSAGGVAGIVAATLIATVVFCCLAVVAVWHFWKRRKVGGLNSQPLGTREQKQGGTSKYAFDNPYFRHDEIKGTTRGLKAGSMLDEVYTNEDKVFPSKVTKPRISKPNQLSDNSQKQRAVDDTCVGLKLERVLVPLRGHDFTGLGFNICGNMRDGIFVKDVLNRGPANESGKIKAGDRIVNVTVSFTSIVYEDALTILSYASPYDVQLEIEKTSEVAQPIVGTNAGRRQGSSSFNRQRLFHPLYRSQSIDDLTRIGKDSHGLAPKRSHTIGLLTHRRNSQFTSKENELMNTNSGRSMSVTTGSLNEKMLANATRKNEHFSKQLSTRSYQRSKRSLLQENEVVAFSKEHFQISQSLSKKHTNREPNLDDPGEEESCSSPKPKITLTCSSVQNTLSELRLHKNCMSGNSPIKKQGLISNKQAISTTLNGNIIRSCIAENSYTDSSDPQYLKSYQDHNNYLKDDYSQTQKRSTDNINSLTQHAEIESSLITVNSEIFNDSLNTEDSEKVSIKSSSLEDLTNVEGALTQSSILLKRAISLDLNQQPRSQSTIPNQNKIYNNPKLDSNNIKDNAFLQNITTTNDSQNVVTLEQNCSVSSTSHTDNISVSATMNQTTFTQVETSMPRHENCCKAFELDQKSDKGNNLSTKEVSHGLINSTAHLLAVTSGITSNTLRCKGDRTKGIDSGAELHIDKSQVTLDKRSSYVSNQVFNPSYPNDKENKNVLGVSQLTLIQQSQHAQRSFTPVSVDIPVIPPVIRHDRRQAPPCGSLISTIAPLSHRKEVFEISKDELDDVMISHQEFVINQTQKLGNKQ